MSGALSLPATNGGLDPNIPLQAGRGVPAPNPLASLATFANTQNALNQAKLFPGQMQLQQQAIAGGATSLAQQQFRAGYGVMIPLLAKPDFTLDDVTNALASGEHNFGIITQPVLADIVANGGPPNTQQWRNVIRSRIASMSQGSPETSVAQVTPRAAEPVMGPNQQLQPTTVNPAGLPNTGVVTVAPNAGIPVGLSPEAASTPTQTGIVPSGPNAGAPITGTRQQFIEQTATPSPLGTGRLPAALRNPAAAPQPIAPVAPSSTPAQPIAPGIVTGLGPAQTAAQTTAGTASAQAFQDISRQGVEAKAQGAILDNMLGDAAQFTTGPGAEGIKDFKAVVQRFAPVVAGAFGIQPDSLAANESFDKLANQLANAQGAGSDARLAVNQGANPSSSRTPAGVDLIIRQLRGNTDYLTARARLAAAYPNQSDRPGFEASVASSLDPRVFQYNRLTPGQKTTFFNAMADKQSFVNSYDWAVGHQLLAPTP